MEGQIILLAVLVGVFLGEGLWLVPRGTWFFRRGMFGTWRAHPAHTLPMIKGFHLCFGGILPSQVSIRTQAPPFLATSEGVCGIHPGLPGPSEAGSEESSLHSWKAIKDLRQEETQLWLGAHVLIRAADEGTARCWRRFLKAHAEFTPDARASRLRKAHEARWNVQDAARRWRRFQRLSPPLFVMAWIQFLLVLVLFPILLISGWIVVYWFPLIALMLINQGCLLTLFRRIRRRIHPDGTKGGGSLAFSLFLSPPYLIRAPEMLTLDIFEGLHPLCVAWVVLKRDAFLEQAETFLRALQHPFLMEGSRLSVQEEIMWQRQDLIRWLSNRGIRSEELLQAPSAIGVRAYCPRCQSEFLRTEGECSACTGIQLVSIPGD